MGKKKIHYLDYIELAYAGSRKPAAGTIRRRIKNGELDGVKEGRAYYVFVDTDITITATGDQLADETLRRFGLLSTAI
jgi:hypothetical protein